MKHHPTHKKLRFVRALSLSLALCVLLGTVFSLPIIAIDTHTAVDTNNDGFCEHENCGGVHVDATNFPDDTFRDWVTSKIAGADDGILTAVELDAVTSIDCSYQRNIQSLKGIEFFTKLTSLDCSRTGLSSLDLSENTALTHLICGNNSSLATINVSQNTELVELNCASVAVSALDLSANTKLEKVYGYSNSKLTSLNLSACTELTYLNIYACTRLTSLDIVNCTKLTELNATQIATPISDFSMYKDLVTLAYSYQPYGASGGTKLTSLNVSENTKLTSLSCNNNDLTSLNLSQNTALTTLSCYGNQLTTLDLSKNTKLTSLSCYGNQLTTLDLSKNTKLTSLTCNNNQLTELDLSANKELTTVSIAQARTVMVGDSQNPVFDMKTLVSDRSKISELTGGTMDADGILTLTDVGNNASVTVTYNYDTGLTAHPLPVTLTVEVTHTHSYDEKDYCAVCKSLRISEISFPDANFRKFITDNVAGADDGFLTEAERLAVTALYMGSQSIADLTGVAFFPELLVLNCDSNSLTALDLSGNLKLKHLYCNSNQITSLNLAANTALEYLYCTGNPLGTLNVSANTALTRLICSDCGLTSLILGSKPSLKLFECYNNQLVTLDVSSFAALESLDCNNNQLIALDVTSNTALTRLNCSDNELRTLDVSQNTALLYFFCSNNHLTELKVDDHPDLLAENISFNGQTHSVELAWGETLDMTTLVSDLSKVTVTSGGTMNTNNGILTFDWTKATVAAVYEYDTGAPEKLIVTVSVASAHDHDFGTTDICSLCREIKISEKTFPDANFRSFVSETYDSNGDGILTRYNVESIHSMDVANRNIADLTGIEYFTYLTQLNCGSNNLTSLDVSNNTKLEELDCYSNKISSLNLQHNSALTAVGCSYNDLTSVFAGGAYNPWLTRFLGTNQTLSIAVPKNTTQYFLGSLAPQEYITVTGGGTYDATTGIVTFTERTDNSHMLYYTYTLPGFAFTLDVEILFLFTDEAPTSVFEEVSVTLGADLSLNVYVKDIGYPAPTMRFTFNGKQVVVNGVAMQMLAESLLEPGQLVRYNVYKFTFTGIAPQNIGDTIEMELFSYDRRIYVESKEYSVLEYLNSLKSKTAADLGYTDAQYDAMVTLIDDLLVYGGAAQAFTDHTGTRVDTGVTGSNTVANSTDTAGNAVGTYVTFNGMNVFFDNANRLMFRFTASDTTGLTFTVRVNGGAEQAISYSADGNGNYILTTDAILATGFDDIYTVTAYKNGVQDTSLSYSVKSYVYAMQNDTNEMAALAKATYAYGCSAKAFAQALAAST